MKKIVNISNTTINLCGYIIKSKEQIILDDAQLIEPVKKKIKIFENLNKINVFNYQESVTNVEANIPITEEKNSKSKSKNSKSKNK